MNPKELFFRKIEAHKPQVTEVASEAGLHNLASSTAHELIGKWVIEDAVEAGLEPVASVGILQVRLDGLKARQAAHRQRVALAFNHFGGSVGRAASTRFGRILEGSVDLGSIAVRPLMLALLAPRVALVRAALDRAHVRDAERQRIRSAGSETLLSLFEHYRVRGAAAAALKTKSGKVEV